MDSFPLNYYLNEGAGFKKLKIDSVNKQSYTITYANLDNTDSYTLEIQKDNTTVPY